MLNLENFKFDFKKNVQPPRNLLPLLSVKELDFNLLEKTKVLLQEVITINRVESDNDLTGSKLNISEKHLNRIVKNCLNKTSSSLIQERVILEAKRMLMHSELNVTEISVALGFNESSYFIRFFKKKTGVTPMGFLNLYIKN